MAELLRRAGLPQGENVRGPILARYIVVSAHDGYRAIFSLPEFDPAIHGQSRASRRQNGWPAAFRPRWAAAPGDAIGKTEARWVRMVERIEILAAPDAVR
jgi:hypothetical protein